MSGHLYTENARALGSNPDYGLAPIVRRVETVTMTLSDFLLARIAEDEDVARGLRNWTTFEMPFYRLYDDDPEVQADFDAKDHAKTLARLLAVNGVPARVLAECEAKRRIVEECAEFRQVTDATAGGAPLAQALAQAGVVQGLERAVAQLASVYADHPDYRDEWRP